jgi:murein DD-endopeptidase MepM/ murein hydrolase activator NlpD
VLAGVVAAIVALVIGVVALAVLACATSGSCTGSAADQPANAVTDRLDILTALAKAHDLSAKRELIRTRGPELQAWLQAQSDATADVSSKAAINKLRTAFQTLMARVEAGIDLGSSDDAKTPSGKTRKQERDEITQAYTEALAVIGQGIPLVIGYVNRVNLQLAQTGRGPYQIPGPGGYYRSGRGNRLHYGYDLTALPGTPIVVGWSGTIRANQGTWGGGNGFGWAVYVEHVENDKRYINQYGHLNFSAGQAERGTPFVQRHGQGDRIPTTVGMTVEPGDVIGYVYQDHLDIKWQVIEGNCVADSFMCRFVNWATSPYRDEAGRE